MDSNQQKIQRYLADLKLALNGQSAGLIQDAMYDAEHHLLDSLAEDENVTFDTLIGDYGTAEEVAQQYIQLEVQTQQFLSGRSKPVSVNGFFQPIFDTSAYKAILYFIVSAPLSLIYFAWFAIVGISTFILSIFGVGIPLLAIYLKLQRYFALIEGQIVNAFLGERMPRRPYSFSKNDDEKSLIQKIKSCLQTRLGWKSTLYTAIQLPLVSIYIALCVSLFFASILLMVSPIVDPIVNYFLPDQSVDIEWYWLPFCVPAGVIGLTISLYISAALSKLHTAIARSLLVE